MQPQTEIDRRAADLQLTMAEATARIKAEKSLETMPHLKESLDTTRMWLKQLCGEVPVNQMGLAHQITAILNQVNERVMWLKDELEFEAEPIEIEGDD